MNEMSEEEKSCKCLSNLPTELQSKIYYYVCNDIFNKYHYKKNDRVFKKDQVYTTGAWSRIFSETFPALPIHLKNGANMLIYTHPRPLLLKDNHTNSDIRYSYDMELDHNTYLYTHSFSLPFTKHFQSGRADLWMEKKDFEVLIDGPNKNFAFVVSFMKNNKTCLWLFNDKISSITQDHGYVATKKFIIPKKPTSLTIDNNDMIIYSINDPKNGGWNVCFEDISTYTMLEKLFIKINPYLKINKTIQAPTSVCLRKIINIMDKKYGTYLCLSQKGDLYIMYYKTDTNELCTIKQKTHGKQFLDIAVDKTRKIGKFYPLVAFLDTDHNVYATHINHKNNKQSLHFTS